jgi:hypothetical protein
MKPEQFTNALLSLLDETFDHVHGYYLDHGTSLFETLAGIGAAEASIPVGGRCATLAAQVKHVAFYLEVVEGSIRDPNYPPADWGEIWGTIGQVTPDEWLRIRAELWQRYERIQALVMETPDWHTEDELGNAMAVVAHTAYHLGEIRQALCTLKV